MGAEFKLVVDAARHLRERDRYHSKKLPSGLKLSYWDADDFRLRSLWWGIRPIRIRTQYGYSIEVHGDIETKDVYQVDGFGSVLRVDGRDLVDFQFAPVAHLMSLGLVLDEFPGSGVRFEYPEREGILDYCSKMDAVIVETAKKLNREKVSQVFSKLYQEFGGADDRLVRRISSFRFLADRFSQDKDRWRPEMKRVGLV